MQYFRYIFIAAYLVYALHKSRIARINLLLFPFLILFGEAAFIRESWMQSYLFSRIDYEILSLIIVWLIIVGPFGNKRNLFAPVSSKILLLFSVLIFVNVILTWESGRWLVSAIHLATAFLYIPLAYFLFYDIFMGFTRDDVLKFLETLIFINTILAVFYIMNSAFGMNIHGIEKWGRAWVMDVYITRDFITFPAMTSFSFIYYLVYFISGDKRNYKSFFIIFVNFVCTLLQYTRSITAFFVVLPILVILLLFIIDGKVKKIAQYSFLYVGLALIMLCASRQFALPQFTYFQQRVLKMPSANQLLERGTIANRINMVINSYSLLEGESILIGYGYLGRENVNRFFQQSMFYRPGDIMWSRFMIEMGVFGTFVFALFLILMLRDSLKLAWGHNLFGLVLFFVTLSYIISTFQSGAFISSPFGLFIFSIVAIEKSKYWLRIRRRAA